MPAIVGLCAVDVKPLGPVQFQVEPLVAVPVRVSVLPAQMGLGLADAVTEVGGAVFTTTDAVFAAAAAPQPLLVLKV